MQSLPGARFARHTSIWAMAISVSGAMSAGRAADLPNLRAELASADTAITVEAGEHAPQLVALRLRGAREWKNRAVETLPQIVDGGAVKSVAWHLDRAASNIEPRQIQLVYLAESPRLRAVWSWRVRDAHGPIEHAVTIQNMGGDAVWLPLLPSFRFDWEADAGIPLERFWVEKGADIPSSVGVHLDELRDGNAWEGTSSTYARPVARRPLEMIPYLLVDDISGERRGWYVGIEFSGLTHITLERNGGSLRGEAGLNPVTTAFRTRLPAGGSFQPPVIFVGAFGGGPDGAGNILRRWVRTVLNNPEVLRDPHYPLMVNNSWGSGMAVDEKLAHRMISDSARLGLEMFHLDAGWFRAVGDWHADPDKFPHGIAALADDAHRRGLKFGLWIDWTQAGTSTAAGALTVDDPTVRDWLIADPPSGWKHSEPFKGITVDLGVPAAKAWTGRELERIVTGYHLDMLEHDGYLVAQGSARADHPAAPPQPGSLKIFEDSGYLWVEGSNSTDVSYHATRAYYDIYEQLRARHPALLLEICNDGGRMVDFGSAAHGDYFSVTDTYDPLANRRAFFDASHVLPPAMLESYVASWPAPRIENFRYALRSGMLGWFSLMQDTGQWTAEQRRDAQRQFALYKSALRPLIRAADVYHVAPRPDGVNWDGIEYYSAALRRGVLYAFRGTADQPTHRFRLAGLKAAGHYRLRFEDGGAAANRVLSGEALMHGGLEITLPLPLSSELVFLEEI
jgi:Melibiase/Glycosyl hydrolase family 36 C-terminal domain